MALPFPSSPEFEQAVRATLIRHGAPLVVAEPLGRELSLEAALVAALGLAHQDSTLFRVLPVVLLRNRSTLDFQLVEQLAADEERLAEWGMLLDVAANLASDAALAARAAGLLRRVGYRERGDFFGARSRGERLLAERRTPPVVRRWGYRMNVTEQMLRAFAEKFG